MKKPKEPTLKQQFRLLQDHVATLESHQADLLNAINELSKALKKGHEAIEAALEDKE